jgi:Leucine-rich repeat (LRR) protein
MEIPSASQSDKAVLGEGYNSKEERFAGRCATGNVEFVGAQESNVNFSRSLSNKELSDSLGFSIGAKARYGMIKGSMSANFASEASSSSYSEATIYSAKYRFKNKRLNYTGLTPEGKAAKGFSDTIFVGENWELVCGHEYVEQVTLGASLYISVKIEFSSKVEKQEFNLQFKVKGPAFQVSGELNQASKSFGSKASITIQGYQLGGDVSRLSAIFGTGPNSRITSPDGKSVHALAVCSMANPDACIKILDSALIYATDTENENSFPQQIKPNSDFANTNNPNGPAELSYITSPWSNLALIPPPAIIADAIEAARDNLSFRFEKNLEYRDRIRALLTGPLRLSRNQRANLEDLDVLVSENLKLINDAATVCYTTLDKCVTKVSQIDSNLKDIDESKLEIFPETIAQWYDNKDLPGTKKSIQSLLNELERITREKVVNFDTAEDKATVVEKTILELDELAFISKGITDITPLSSLKNLKRLNINQSEDIADISPLSSLVELRDLAIPCRLADIEQLKSLTKLEDFTYFGSDTDLRSLSSFISLKSLALHTVGSIVDISPLSSLINLENLFLQTNQVIDVSPLASLNKLTYLILFDNQIVDVSPLASLTNLDTLLLQKNQIVDVSPLASLTNLESLALDENRITDISALASLTKLKFLSIKDNPITNKVCPVADPEGKICRFGNSRERMHSDDSSITLQAFIEEDDDSYMLYPDPFSKQFKYKVLKENVIVLENTNIAYLNGESIPLHTVRINKDYRLEKIENLKLSTFVSESLQPSDSNFLEQVNGIVRNESSKSVWVVETNTGSAIAHILAPGKTSPPHIDADGVKAYDLGVTLSGHTSWWKIFSPDTAIIGNLPNGQLKIFSFAGFKVDEDEFGQVRYDYSSGWGV